MAKKKFTNNTKHHLLIKLLIREANTVENPSLEKEFELTIGETIKVTLGKNNRYLNGLEIFWKDDTEKTMRSVSYKIFETGVSPTLDWELNTHKTIVLNYYMSTITITTSD